MNGALDVVAIIPAGGSGRRFGGELPKQFLLLDGRPLLARTIDRLEASGVIAEMIVAIPDEHRARMEDLLAQNSWKTPIRLVAGGPTRQESVWNALQAVTDAELVAVHDAVRPNFPTELLRDLLAAARAVGGAIPALPLTETIHRVRDGIIDESPTRDEWVSAQTPQCFRLPLLRTALERARSEGFVGTDEACVVARYGGRVRVLSGDPANLKVTVPRDLERLGRGEEP